MAKKLSILLIATFLSLLLVANHAVANKEVEATKEVEANNAEAKIELVTNNPEAINENEQRHRQTRLREARQCRLQSISASQPSRSIQSEGGVTEFWDEFEDQFQCTGVAAMRNTIQPNSLSLPNYSPSPRLVYIEQGRGLLGITFPGCPDTYHSSRGGQSERGSEDRSEEHEGRRRRSDQHQKVHRVRRGHLVAIPAGVAHWCLNDGNEELVAVSVSDLNNQANQLDQKLRSYYLAGGRNHESQRGPQRRQQQGETYQNIFRAFDENLMAEALNVPVETVRKMQREDKRGYIVRVREDMSVIRPDEYKEDDEREESREGGHRYGQREGRSNGLEETVCTARIHHYMDNPREADVYSRHAGRLNLVNKLKLPILSYLDLSAEKGKLLPNAIHAPHWTMNAHSIVYVTRGEAHVEVVGNNGERLLDDKVRQGDIFNVPQYFASTARAGRNGFEWVAFKTSAMPIKNSLVGSTSVFRAMPAQVLAESYGLRIQEAHNLKFGREQHTVLLPPSRSSSN
ncbi:11S globulin seed storage protein 2-like [Telopea speciosissima]|uniref:11S globulin seed storage protein 2-like n=1 Tax=Telopea speciosissima TaxID=54955 RepID=UPI001CC6D6D0|nr:11S globulin seed storage protein 2-like [Telopea speciosissima]